MKTNQSDVVTTEASVGLLGGGLSSWDRMCHHIKGYESGSWLILVGLLWWVTGCMCVCVIVCV